MIRMSHFLAAPYQSRVRRMIQEYEGIYGQAIAAEYMLDDEDLHQATKALLGLGSSVIDWYSTDDPRKAHDVAMSYIGFCRAILARAASDAALRAGPSKSEADQEPAAEEIFRRIGHQINVTVRARRMGWFDAWAGRERISLM